ncbi:NHL repeat-containing protein [Maridesulfovibrio frigidus]|uniref:hypothetical protein n=1 Tax=Maridesulfovibrio frigidus TaxID=340956 RepID=UPI0006917F58|nr:hypothetical protein [Maridesulfovibrio frigidus]
MKRYLVAFICLVFVMSLGACSSKSLKVDGFSAPESVTSDGTYFYVSNVGEKLKPMDKDSDGYISKLSAEGEVLEHRFIKDLNAPKGMVTLNGVLYVADIDVLKGFAVETGEQVFSLDFSSEGTSFLNGVTVLNEKSILVSAMDTGKIYEVDIAGKPSFVEVEVEFGIPGANGLSYVPEDETLYVATFGTDHKPNGFVGKGRLENGKLSFKKIHTTGGMYDGMSVDGDNAYFSDWVAFEKKGVVLKLDMKTGKVEEVALPEKVAGPADFYLDKKSKRLWIPMMMENSLLIAPY